MPLTDTGIPATTATNNNNLGKSDGTRGGSRLNSMINKSLSFFGLDSQDSTLENWSERRLRYVIKRYGSVRGERFQSLAGSSGPYDGLCGRSHLPSSSQPLKIKTRRQVSFANESHPATNESHAVTNELHRAEFTRQGSVLTTASLPTIRKQHAVLMLLSALWNSPIRFIPKRPESPEQPSSFKRFHSAPADRTAILDDHHYSHFPLNEKWIALKESKPETISFLTAFRASSASNGAEEVRENFIERNVVSEQAFTHENDTPQSPVSLESFNPYRMGIFGSIPATRSRGTTTTSIPTLLHIPKRLTGNIRSPKWASVIFSPRKNSFTEDIYLNKTTDFAEYRPYFTYWITFVHFIIFVIIAIDYGFAPIGIGVGIRIKSKVQLPTLTMDQVCWTEYENMWIGPRQTDLIRLGARFPPCMRFDPILYQQVIERQKKFDRESGCCIRNDGGGCYQTHRDVCSRTLATWLHYGANEYSEQTEKFSKQNMAIKDNLPNMSYMMNSNFNTSVFGQFIPNQRSLVRLVGKAGPVCGLDPEFCLQPRSSGAFSWSETDVTQWPICEVPVNISNMGGYAPHMECQVTGHPCCLGIKGECIITTEEHCNFVRGFYNPNAALCSQVNCLHQICGMSPFIENEQPNQFYRIFTSLFLHAGALHLLVTFGVQMIFMRDLEKLIGWHRIALVYLLSGYVGSLTSGIFLPYQVETGPTAAQFALLGVVLVDFIYCWSLLLHPWCALLRNLFLFIILFLFGLLPWVDNYANTSSFISGILLSFILLPYRDFNYYYHYHHHHPHHHYYNYNYFYHQQHQYPDDEQPQSPQESYFNYQLSDLNTKFNFNHQQCNNSSVTTPTVPITSQQQQQQFNNNSNNNNDSSTKIEQNRLCRFWIMLICSILWILLAFSLTILFLKGPIINCEYCNYFTCLPFTSSFCDNLQINVKQRSDCIAPNWG